MVLHLLKTDFENSKLFAEIMFGMINEETVLKMSNEAHFYMAGYTNKQNFRYWKPKTPQVLHERPLRSTPVTV